MSEAEPALAASFDSPLHSDLQLLVYTDTGTEKKAKKAKKGKGRSCKPVCAPARSYHCHAVILSSLSGYLKAQLSSEWLHTPDPAATTTTTSPAAATKRTVDVHVEAEELDAFHEFLKMLYTQTLPSAPPTEPIFLQVLRLADSFEAVRCTELLVGALAGVPTEAINSTLLTYAFQSPPGVCVSRSYPALLASCSKALVRLYGDVPAVIRTEALLHQFCCLPHAAVLAWVKSDSLQVHSENCVAFLLAAWVQANRSHEGSTAAQHEELAQHIRAFHLGPAYLHHILPGLTWFSKSECSEYLPAVSTCIRAGIHMEQGWEAEKSQVRDAGFPPGWCAKPRSRSSSPRTCSWVLIPSQVKEVDEGEKLMLPSPVSINGFLIRLSIQQTATTSSSPGKTLGMFLGVDGAAMARRGLPLPTRFLLRFGASHVKVGSSGSRLRNETSLLSSSTVYQAASTWGMRDILGTAAPTIRELVAPYLDAGQLHVEIQFSAIDA